MFTAQENTKLGCMVFTTFQLMAIWYLPAKRAFVNTKLFISEIEIVNGDIHRLIV